MDRSFTQLPEKTFKGEQPQPCTSTPVANLDPQLPPEIEQEIFEWAFHLSRAKKRPSPPINLMLVAHRVHQWIAALIYRVAQQLVIPYFPPRGNGPQVDYFGTFVKHLIIGGGKMDISTMSEFLNECPNLINLALWSLHPTKQLLNSIEKMSLQRLSTNLSSLDEQDFKGPAFSCITHLDITNLKGDWTRYKVLTHIPQVTHIAINKVVDMKAIHHILQYCPKLQILLVVTDDIPSWKLDLEDIHLYDPRLVMMNAQRFTLQEWKNGTNGKEDLWEGPEVISASKTYGRLKKEQFCTWFSNYSWRQELDDLEVGRPEVMAPPVDGKDK